MACILLIESSAQTCSISVSIDGKPAWYRENKEQFSHSSVLGVYASEAIRFVHSNRFRLDAVAVSEGPGSYTGLRIGISLAKGLCFAMDIPMIAIPTLKIMAARFSPTSSYLRPMMDARRMEVYSALYDGNLNEIEPASSLIINEDSFQNQTDQNDILFFGSGIIKCKAFIRASNVVYVEDVYPSALNMTNEAEKAYHRLEFADIAYFEPVYLKEFQATTPKNKVIPIITNTL